MNNNKKKLEEMEKCLIIVSSTRNILIKINNIIRTYMWTLNNKGTYFGKCICLFKNKPHLAAKMSYNSNSCYNSSKKYMLKVFL